MSTTNWLVAAGVVLLTCVITWAALSWVTRYCERFPLADHTVADEELS